MTQLRQDGYFTCGAGKCFSNDGSFSCAHTGRRGAGIDIVTPEEQRLSALRELALDWGRSESTRMRRYAEDDRLWDTLRAVKASLPTLTGGLPRATVCLDDTLPHDIQFWPVR